MLKRGFGVPETVYKYIAKVKVKSNMNRRRFVSGAGLTLAVPFAGCLSAPANDGNSQGTEDSPVRFWLEEMSLSTSERDAFNPIVFGELSTGERNIVQTALEEEEYTVDQGSEPPVLETLRDRIEQRTGNGETLEVYLKREENHYGVGFVDGDHIIANPDH
jgi:hypothetical protein